MEGAETNKKTAGRLVSGNKAASVSARLHARKRGAAQAAEEGEERGRWMKKVEEGGRGLVSSAELDSIVTRGQALSPSPLSISVHCKAVPFETAAIMWLQAGAQWV